MQDLSNSGTNLQSQQQLFTKTIIIHFVHLGIAHQEKHSPRTSILRSSKSRVQHPIKLQTWIKRHQIGQIQSIFDIFQLILSSNVQFNQKIIFLESTAPNICDSCQFLAQIDQTSEGFLATMTQTAIFLHRSSVSELLKEQNDYFGI